jgi:hypothetical protein
MTRGGGWDDLLDAFAELVGAIERDDLEAAGHAPAAPGPAPTRAARPDQVARLGVLQQRAERALADLERRRRDVGGELGGLDTRRRAAATYRR